MGEYGMSEDRYSADLQRGLEYQDYVFDQIRAMDGMPIFLGAYSSLKYQCGKGESPSGIEVKYDAKFRETGNLFIETAEKSYSYQASFHPSGVMSEDNSWLYLIGDYDEAFIFAKNLLCAFCVPNNPYVKYREIATAQGYIFPIKYVNDKCLCAKHIYFKGSEKS